MLEKGPSLLSNTCTAVDQSAHETLDLVVPSYETAEDISHRIVAHGSLILPDILTEKSAQIMHEAFSYYFDHDESHLASNDDSLRKKAFRVHDYPLLLVIVQDILSNIRLKESLENLLGGEPALVEMYVMNVSCKSHHSGVLLGSSRGSSIHQTTLYTLYIPLQTIYTDMSSIHIAPGTHICQSVSTTTTAMDQGDNDDDTINLGFRLYQDQAWPVGTALLLDRDVSHQAVCRTRDDTPDTTFFVLTWAPRPPDRVQGRLRQHLPPLVMHWSLWGHTYSDFVYADERLLEPWTVLRSLGLYKAPGTHWGWDYVTDAMVSIALEDSGWSRLDFENNLNKGSLAKLPLPLLETDTRHHQPMASDGWLLFVEQLLFRLEDFFRFAHRCSLVWYFMGAAAINKMIYAPDYRQLRGANISIWDIVRRLLLTHFVLLLLSWVAWRRIPQFFDD
jgi:hypothetical protein